MRENWESLVLAGVGICAFLTGLGLWAIGFGTRFSCKSRARQTREALRAKEARKAADRR